MIESGDRILVAVSGGADSTGLAIVMRELCARLDCEIVLGHVHHGLRGADADADELAAESVAARLGLPFLSTALRLIDGGNLEARAREARYQALGTMAKEAECIKIATGHTRDDQAETFLLRLLSGAGVDGLTAIQPARADGVIRPLIDCRRTAVAGVVADLGFDARDDATNANPRFLRARVRHELMPVLRDLNPEIADLCARSVDSLRGARAAQDQWATSQLVRDAAGAGSLELGALVPMSADLRRVLVWAWLREALPDTRVTARHVDAIVDLAEPARRGTEVALPGDLRVERSGDHLQLKAGQRLATEAVVQLNLGESLELANGWMLRTRVCDGAGLEMPRDLWTAVCDIDAGQELVVRAPRRGEKVRPLGLGGSKPLAEILRERKIPRSERASYPVVATQDELLWVPGVVRSAATAVGKTTKRAAILHARRLTVAGGGGA